MHAAIHTPWAGAPPNRYTLWAITPPLAGTPLLQVHPLSLAGTPPGRYPLVDTPPIRYTPRQVYLPGRYNPLAGTPPGQTPLPHAQCMLGYGKQVGGTHPTGMHSCVLLFSQMCQDG